MDLIYTQPYIQEQGIIEIGFLNNCKIDVEIGTVSSSARNDFEITIYEKNLPIQKGALIYDASGSEIGGMVQGIKINTSQNEITLFCKLWRGMLRDHIVRPPKDLDYYTFNGDANQVLSNLIGNSYDGLIVASDKVSGIMINGKTRYRDILTVFEDALADVHAALKITFNGVQAVCEAVMTNDQSETICLDNDYGIPIIAEDNDCGRYNHIVALGQGELKDRQVVEMWRLEDGAVTEDETKDIPKGLQLRTYIYDYSSVESLEELKKETFKKMNELCSIQKLELDFTEGKLEIGDIVSAKERMTGIQMKKQITRKVISGEILNGISFLKTTYKVGE